MIAFIILQIVFWLTFLLIFHTQVGYGIILFLMKKFNGGQKRANQKRVNQKTFNQKTEKLNELPYVSYIIVAHNEEEIIEAKITNALSCNYPKDKLEIIVASDNSTDQTNEIVRSFSNHGVKLFVVNKRGGKTNAQNECFEHAKGEFVAFSDANAMWEQDALLKMVDLMTSADDIAYVCGKLSYINNSESASLSEGFYWKYDLWLRSMENELCSITAGNGSIYLVRRSEYEYIDPLYCHDLCFPSIMMAKGKKALYREDAVSFENAGTKFSDEWKRKVRMAGRTWSYLVDNLWMCNAFKVGALYSFMMVSHRLLRYLLPMLHVTLYFMNLALAVTESNISNNHIYLMLLILHSIFYALAAIGYITGIRHLILVIPAGYCNFMFSYLIGFMKYLKGDISPFWSKVESTRTSI